MNFQLDIVSQLLHRHLKNRLPGNVSHAKMLPPGRILEIPSDQEHIHESAVLLLLFPYQQDTRICLIRRPATMKNHAGQIAFPGGKREKQDVDLVQTALREAEEEIGLCRESVEILGTLSTVYVQISDFLITPVVGWMPEMPEIKIDLSEVDEVIFVSLEDLTNEQNRCDREMETRTGRLFVPGYEIDGCFIWGATAMMLAELADIVLRAD